MATGQSQNGLHTLGGENTTQQPKTTQTPKPPPQPDGYIILLKGNKTSKQQRYYIINLNHDQINKFWQCLATHIKPPQPTNK